MRFTDSFLDEIRNRVPISAVVAPRVTWDRRKTNTARGDWWACCPFHGESTPSFHCEDMKGRYHCFGCGVSGDHFRFLTELDGLSFPEAVERVAEMAGVALPRRDPAIEKREEKRSTLFEVMELAAQFYQERLQEGDGARARAYLRERGISAATQQRFRLGLAPPGRNRLKEHLAASGVDRERIEACGLVVHGPEIPVSYDRFRDRIMFPILDPRGRVIAFGGRALSPGVPAKYLNSPETELFHKGDVLYNYGPARAAAGRNGKLIVVEGYMDVIALAQAGFDNAVAPLGTALTEEQLERLWRVSGEPVFCFDGDEAGLKAAWRVADLALPSIRADKTVRFALLPPGQDPDDLVRHSGADAFSRVVAEARPLAEILWTRETASGVFDSPERRAALEKRLREAVQRIRDEDIRRHFHQSMRDRVQAFFGGPARFPRGEGPRKPPRQAAPGRLSVSEGVQRSALVTGGALPVRECAILAALVNHPALFEHFHDQIETLEFNHPELARLLRCVLDAVAEGAEETAAIRAVIERQGASDPYDRAMDLLRRTRHWPVLEGATQEDARDALAQALHLHRAFGALHRELRAAEAALANDPTDENYRRLLDIRAQFSDTRGTEAMIDGFGSSSVRYGRGA